jgi:hypothetical protein
VTPEAVASPVALPAMNDEVGVNVTPEAVPLATPFPANEPSSLVPNPKPIGRVFLATAAY